MSVKDTDKTVVDTILQHNFSDPMDKNGWFAGVLCAYGTAHTDIVDRFSNRTLFGNLNLIPSGNLIGPSIGT